MNDYSRKMMKVPTYNLLREQDIDKHLAEMQEAITNMVNQNEENSKAPD